MPEEEVDIMPEELWTKVHNIVQEVMNRFKGLDLIDCLKNYGWTFCNIVQEAVTKTIPKKNPRRQNGCLRRIYK